MRAGLLRYRLCNQRFDCEHCLLDAALRGGFAAPPYAVGLGVGTPGSPIREDRLYTRGHLWLQPLNGGKLYRVGVDAFASAILGNVFAVRCRAVNAPLEAKDPICHIDIGQAQVRFGAPGRGHVARQNEALNHQPALLLRAPYDEGWLLELRATNPADLARLASPDAARRQIRLDLKRFRRALARQLLISAAGDGSMLADESHTFTDLRQLLAGSHYSKLITAFVH